MPSFIFWPSSLAGPVNGAEIPNRISLSVTPRTIVLTLFCSPRGCDDARDVCWPCMSGACWSSTLGDGTPPEAVATTVAGTRARLAGVSFAVTRSNGLVTTCFVSKSQLSSGRTPSNRGLPKTINNAASAATTPTSAMRPISDSSPSPGGAAGSGIGSGHKSDSGLVWWSRTNSGEDGTVDAEMR